MSQNVNIFKPEENVDAVKQYSVDITALAREGKIDPVIGREEEIRRIIQILSRRTKNNPVLIGEPGTGKTTVVEGLAKRIIDGDIPEHFRDRTVLSLDLGAMLAGASYRGQFEERLKNFIKKVLEKSDEYIVFIDELHTIIGTGASEGQLDVGNIIKPELARGRMKVIGATTLREYQKYIEKDAALERRFQQVYISEPSEEDAVTILRGIKDRYELHHGIRIKDSALISAVSLSNRYISDRFLPDKAIDLMDEAASRLRTEINSMPAGIDDLRRLSIQLEIEKESLKKEKDSRSRERREAIDHELQDISQQLNELSSRWSREKALVGKLNGLKEEIDRLTQQMVFLERQGELNQVAKLKYSDIPALEKEIESLNEQITTFSFVKLEVDSDDIAAVVSRWTGIPVSKMMESDIEKTARLEEYLRRRVRGQEEALRSVADVIRMSRAGISDRERPLGSFIFMGSTGVGKTELAKSLAQTLFDDENALVRVDMSEYMEAHSISRMIGSPPGYVGYDDGGQLTERIRRRPYAVILFDEIEKAHPQVLNLLLQILDDGRLTDSKGRTVNFKNTVIIMTSNLSSGEIKKQLRPEFINRVDEIIHFNELQHNTILEIIDIQLQILKNRLSEEGRDLSIAENVPEKILEKAWLPEYGARSVKRYIKQQITARLARTMLLYPDRKSFSIQLVDNEISCEI